MERQWITVREYAHLTTPVTPGMASTLDHVQISPSAFDWLCKLQAGLNDTGARLIVLDNRRTLRLDSYVGTISTPCGTDIEILPKHFSSTDPIEKSRQLMCRLIASALNLPWREAGNADLNLFYYPLSEWVIRQFLAALGQLIKRGLRFDYQQVDEDEQPFLRGQLDMSRQLRQLPGSQHRFHQRQTLFLPNRPENRLLRLALDKICLETQKPQNWRLSHEFINLMQEVPPSRQVNPDFARWGNDRLMMHYRAIRPWCQLVLGEQLPLAIQGTARGISLLFPMDRLFEQHVARVLKHQLLSGVTLHSQATSEHLCRYNDTKLFLLKPDLVLMHGEKKWVLDTKWKRLEQVNGDDYCRFSQSDIYQMLAYGMRYLQPQQDLLLIYPKSAGFSIPVGPYILPNELRLHALPFDRDNDLLLGSEAVRMPLDRLA